MRSIIARVVMLHDVAQLEIRTNPDALLGEPLATGLRGAGEAPVAFWQAKLRDDDERVWRSSARTPAELGTQWRPAKASTGAIAALRSLRPLTIELRAELPDGRAATRTVTRRLLADGVQVRSWNGLTPLRATLYLPPRNGATDALVIDARNAETSEALAPTAAWLASTGAVIVTVEPGKTADATFDELLALLAAVPALAADTTPRVIDLPQLPPGFPAMT